jgi:hypothetical protein
MTGKSLYWFIMFTIGACALLAFASDWIVEGIILAALFVVGLVYGKLLQNSEPAPG